MAGSFRYPLIVAGTCAILALAAVGCTSTPNNAPAASQTEVENVEASVTERGQSEQEDLDVAAEAGETDTEDVNGYADKTFRVAFELPEGFEAHHLDSEYEDERVAFFCCTEDGRSEASFTTCSDVRKFADVTDEKSWAEAFASTYVKGMEKAGETAIQKATGTVKFSDKVQGTAVKITSKDGTATIHRDFYFLVNDKGDGLRILLRTDDEDVLKTLQQSLSETE